MLREEYENNAGHILLIEQFGENDFEVTIDTGTAEKIRKFKKRASAVGFANLAMAHPKSGTWKQICSQWATDYRAEQGTY